MSYLSDLIREYRAAADKLPDMDPAQGAALMIDSVTSIYRAAMRDPRNPHHIAKIADELILKEGVDIGGEQFAKGIALLGRTIRKADYQATGLDLY